MSNWQPSATIHHLKERSKIIKKIRQFFEERKILEVETPLLSESAVTDPYLHSFKVDSHPVTYLQTSPEFSMKRLLSAGSGSIYQICKSFREDEKGRFHQREFTMLEWYRVEFTHHDLMDEMDALLQSILECSSAERFSYAEIFEKYLKMNPHTISISNLKLTLKERGLGELITLAGEDKDLYLQLLMTNCIEPNFSKQKPTFIYDYPVTQAALAKIRKDDPPVAERFEVYMGSIELGNGFHELCDAKEQRDRFERDVEKRKVLGYQLVPMDHHLLAALESGLPDCAGVALGLDRLVMLALDENNIQSVISFCE